MFLILRKPRSGCLEGRTALIQPIVNCFTGSFAGMTMGSSNSLRILVLVSFSDTGGNGLGARANADS